MFVYAYAEYVGKKETLDLIVSLLGYVPSKEDLDDIEAEFLLIDESSEYYEQYLRFNFVLWRCGLDDFGKTFCEFAVLFALYPEILHSLCGNRGGLTVENALKFIDVNLFATDDYDKNKSTFERLSKILLPDSDSQDLPYFKRGLTLDSRFIDYICSYNISDDYYDDVFYLSEQENEKLESEVHLQFIDKTAEYLGEDNAFLHLVGEDDKELIYIAEHAGRKHDRNFLVVDFVKFYRAFKDEKPVLWALMRELIFYEVSLVIHNISFLDEDAEKTAFCLDFIREEITVLSGAPICLISDKSVNLTPHLDRMLTVINVLDYTRSERIELFTYYAKELGLLDVLNCGDLAGKYKLNRNETKKALAIIKSAKNPDEKFIANACNSVIPDPRQGNIKKITATYTLDQLKLNARQRTAIENIIDHVRHRIKVYDDWGMETKYAYGKNVSALLVGPPGTGKTMAVHVMSNILNLPLYSINLSQVVDKYIGETEKRLEDIFAAAEKSNVILFFDEADSIFGKRSDVNDAKDKYANTEVSYILQRLEQYEGIVILATNLKKNIDDAFMRRMRYIVEFPQPTKELRLEIWQSVFASEVPLKEIDFDFLAQQYELSGGAIKNIALNATFLAAAQDRAVTMRDILMSLRNENSKLGKTMLLHDFDKYAVLMADVF